MKKSMFPGAYLLGGTENDARSLGIMFVLSAAGHLILLVMLIFAPGITSGKKFSASVINVSLVALPGPGTASGPGRPAAAKSEKQLVKPEEPKKPALKEEAVSVPKPVTEPLEKTAPEPEKKVSVAPEKMVKTSLKEKTFKPSQVVKSAIKRMEEEAKDSRPNSVSEAIDRLKDKIGKADSREGARNDLKSGAPGPGIGIAGGSAGAGGKLAPEIFVYQQEIAAHIKNNWVFSEGLAGGRADLETRLMIKIMASGEIKDIWFEKRSGNSYLDDSAYKAVIKSNPLPALPRGYVAYTVLLGFTPSGLQ